MNKEKVQRLEAIVLRTNLLFDYCKRAGNNNSQVKNRKKGSQVWKRIGGLFLSLLFTKPVRRKLSRYSRFFKMLYRAIS